MREHLLGYLLGALEPPEQELVETRLSEDVELQKELSVLQRGLEPLAADDDKFEPPSGLARRTCDYVTNRQSIGAPSGDLAPAGGWRLQDWIAVVGIAVAASMLVFPAIAQSRFNARLQSCGNNLRSLGMALFQYSEFHHGAFPHVPESGNMSAAGIYGPLLYEAGFVRDRSMLICPSSSLAREVGFHFPTLNEIRQAGPNELPFFHRWMGGSYGYTLGYVLNGRYYGQRNLGRSTFALMADAPDERTGSANHGCCGQNVLFDDGHVAFLKSCRLAERDDHIFENRHGYVGPGIGPDDSVIARSSAQPVRLQTVELNP